MQHLKGLAGSGRSFTAYVFNRIGANKIRRAMSSDAADLLPSTPVALEQPRKEPLGRRASLDTAAAADRPDFGAASEAERALLQSTPKMARREPSFTSAALKMIACVHAVDGFDRLRQYSILVYICKE